MPGACLNPYGCEWGIGHLWRWMNWIGRADVILLALLLVYTLALLVRISYRCHAARRAPKTDNAGQRKLGSELNIEVGSLKSIALVAPYLGLVGTCFGVMSGFRGIGMERNAALAVMTLTITAALVTTAAGIIVAVAATCSYNYLRVCLDLLQNEVPTWRLPLRERLSTLPAFALIAAPGLAILVAAYMTFASFYTPTGFAVELASPGCDSGDDPPIVLHISGRGRLYLNSEQEEWSTLASRLSDIYSVRVHRTLYLFGDVDVPFQTVANAIDIADNLAIKPKLVTPKALNSRCPEPALLGVSKHASR